MERWEEDDTLRVLLRTAVTNEAAAERMRQVFIGQLTPAFERAAMDEPAVRAGLIATQALGFALCRYILEFEPIVGLSTDDAVAWLGPTITRYLTSPLPSQL